MEIIDKHSINLKDQGLRIDFKDFNRPWGGFFVLDEEQAQEFADIYFDGLDVSGCGWEVES